MKSTRETFSLPGLKAVAHAFDAHRGRLDVHQEAIRAGLRRDAHIPFPFIPKANKADPIVWISGWGGSGACYMANTLQRDAVRTGRRVLTLSAYDDRDQRISVDDSITLEITGAIMEEKREEGEIATLLARGASFSHVRMATHMHSDNLMFWPRIVDVISEGMPANTMLCLNLKSLPWMLDFGRLREIATMLQEKGSCLVILPALTIETMPLEVLAQDIFFQGKFCPQTPSIMGLQTSTFEHLRPGEFFRHEDGMLKQVNVPLEPVRVWEPAVGTGAALIRQRLDMLSSATWRYEPEMAWDFTAKAAGFKDWAAVEKFAARKSSPLGALWPTPVQPARRATLKDMEELHGPVTKKWGKFFRRDRWGHPGPEICDFRDLRS